MMNSQAKPAKMVADTDEGRAIADALIIFGNCLYLISIKGTGRFKYVPNEEIKRTPTELIRRSMTKLLDRYRQVLKAAMCDMYWR